MNEWLEHNRRIGARVGMRLSDGRVVNASMLSNEPLFTDYDEGQEPDENVINLLTLTADQHITEKLKMGTSVIEATSEKMESAALILSRTNKKMCDESASLAERLKKNSSQVKDFAERLNVSLSRFGSTIESAKMRDSVDQVERLVSAMERLAALQDSGKLDKVMQAIK